MFSSHGIKAYVHYTSVNSPPTLDFMRVVREFMNEFLTNLPSMLMDLDIDFSINVKLGTMPISISPYIIP